LHIVGFIAGAFAASAIVVAVAFGAGFSTWAAIGFGAASFGLAQALYIIWLVGMERAETRRRKAAAAGSESSPAKTNHNVVQKS
jgi:hypothetical protein